MKATKSIPTKYSGHTFRSRLEARVAVFFDVLNLSWEYEPEGYDLPINGWYLPDFLLKKNEKLKHDIWVECKGKEPTIEEDNKLNELACTTGILGGFFISSETFTRNYHTLTKYPEKIYFNGKSFYDHDLRGFGTDLDHYLKPLRYPLPHYIPFSRWYSLREELTPDDKGFILNYVNERDSGRYYPPLTTNEIKELEQTKSREAIEFIESNIAARNRIWDYIEPHSLDYFGEGDDDVSSVPLFKKAIEVALSYQF